MSKIQKILASAAIFSPSFALAAADTSIVTSWISAVQTFVEAVVPVLMALGLVYFLWGIVKYIMAGSDETKKVDAKKIIVNGLIGLFLMVAVWGLVQVIVTTTGVSTTQSFNKPNVPK